MEESEGWDEDNVDGDDPWDLQAGHGTHIVGMIYAQELMEGDNSIISRREKFRRVSHVWHCFLGIPVSTLGGWHEWESQEEAASVRGGDARRIVGPVEAIARSRHPCRVREDVGE